MYKLGLEKAEEPEIKLPTSVRSQRKQGNFRKTSTSASLTTLKPLTVWITTNCWILKEMGIPDHLTCLLRNLYAGQESTVRTRHGTTNWFKIWKGVLQCRVHNVKCRAGWSTSWIKIAGRYADDITLMEESEEELKGFLMRLKEESEKFAWNSNSKN